jgi:hypothetical protein
MPVATTNNKRKTVPESSYDTRICAALTTALAVPMRTATQTVSCTALHVHIPTVNSTLFDITNKSVSSWPVTRSWQQWSAAYVY